MQRTVDMPAPSNGLSRPVANVILCAVLMAATAWAVLAAGWAQNAGGAFVVAVAAAVEGGLLARAMVHRAVAILLAPVLALAAIVPTTMGAMPFDGDTTAAHAVGRFASAIFTGLGSNGDWEFTVGLCAVLWVCGYWLAWMALREGRAVLGVLPVYAVLATNVLNAKAPDMAGVPEAVAVLASLLVIAGAHLDSLQARWDSGRVIPLPGTRSMFATSVGVTAVGLTIAALLIPSATTNDISTRFFPGSAKGGSHSGGGGGKGSIQFNPNTEPGGPLVSQPVNVLTYYTDNNTPTYLRVVNDVLFSAGDWFPGSTEQFPEDGVAQSTVNDPGGSVPRDRSAADGGVGSAESTVTATLTFQLPATGSSSLVPFPGDPDWSNQLGTVAGEVPFAQSSGLGTLPLTVDALEAPSALTTGTVVQSRGYTSTATVPQLESAGTDYPAFTQPYTQIQDDATGGLQIIRQLAQQWTAGTNNPYDAAVAIESRLRDPRFFTYTLNTTTPPAGEWSIVYFLTKTHQGYCQYFASSMGAMLRALGIPTRLVSGYGPGSTLGDRARNGNTQQQVTTTDAHVWVESYFPGYGWIQFEPTPPSSNGDYVQFHRGSLTSTSPSPTQAPVSSTPQPKPGFGGAPGNAPGAGAAHAASPAGIIALIILGVIVLVALLLFAWMLLPRSLRGAWRRLEVLGAMVGVRRRPDETYFEYARRFDETTTSELRSSLTGMAEELSRSEFSTALGDAEQLRRVKLQWHRILLRAPRSARLALRRPRRHRVVSEV
ncbi:MAG: hypothetical protein JOY68_07975 [Candidatus Dormibacteraeota bacterium]|nr:hypothetical protein [Candidatus Dormibacteraeota bacterium]